MQKRVQFGFQFSAILLAGLCVLPARAASYHVALSGSDQTGTGTTANPFASIQRGAQAAKSGDTVYVGAGTYNVPATWNASANKTTAILSLATSGVTFKAESGVTSHPVVTFPTRTNYSTYVEITGSNIVWDGIDVNNGVYDIYAHNGSNLTVQNCTVQWSQYSGIELENYNSVTVNNCNVHDCSQINGTRDGSSGTWSHAIIGYNANYVTVQNSTIHNNAGEGVGPYLGCSNWTIYNNTVYDNYSINIYVDTDVAQSGMTVDNNTVYDTGTVGSGDRNLAVGVRVANENADYNKSNTGINAIIHGVSIHDNTISNCGGALESFAYNNGPYRLADSTFYNNKVSGTRNHSDGSAFAAVTIWGIVGNKVDYAYNQVRGGSINIDAAVNQYGNY